MEVRIPISERARKYGYIIWPKRLDEALKDLLGEDTESAEVVFDGTILGRKRIDWKHRRISVGPSRTASIDAGVSEYELASSRVGHIDVSLRQG